MTTVRQVLQSKGSQVWTISPKATVFQVLELMAEKDIGAVLVTEEADHPIGIFTERDYARKVVLKGRVSKNVTVGEIMSHGVFVIPPDITLENCMQIMTARKIRHLPVIENDRLTGVISIGDVVKYLLADSKFAIQELERYIVGPSYPGE